MTRSMRIGPEELPVSSVEVHEQRHAWNTLKHRPSETTETHTSSFIFNRTYMIYNERISQKHIEMSHIKSNQITFIVTWPQHMCLGEWILRACSRQYNIDNLHIDSTYLQTYTEDNVSTQCIIRHAYSYQYTLYIMYTYTHNGMRKN